MEEMRLRPEAGLKKAACAVSSLGFPGCTGWEFSLESQEAQWRRERGCELCVCRRHLLHSPSPRPSQALPPRGGQHKYLLSM